jgi:3-oxoacyl-[acyl-carrier-protein] synthase II
MTDMANAMAARAMMRDSDDAAEGDGARKGEIHDFDLQDFIESKKPYLDPHSKSALAAAALTFESASIAWDEVDHDRIGLSYGTMLGNPDTMKRFQDMVNEKGMRLASPVLFGHTYPNTTSSLIAIEYGLRGYNQNFCGGPLCGAQALAAALSALRQGRADMMLAGGGDVISLDRLKTVTEAGKDEPMPAQGVGLVLLETRESAEVREGFAFCELASVVCLAGTSAGPAEGLCQALEAAVQQAMEEAGIWEGDIGVVFTCGAPTGMPGAKQAQDAVLSEFAEVPTVSSKAYVGDTFAGSFPLEVIAAADVLNSGIMPPRLSFANKRKGVEFWVEEQPEPLMGHAALVIGCTSESVAACVLRGL